MRLFLAFVMLWGITSDAFSQKNNENLSLDALLNLKISLATKQEQSLDEAPSVVAVITQQEMYQAGARNLEDVLRSIAGFDVVMNPQSSNMAIGVRGISNLRFHNNAIKFLVDGHPLNSIVGSPYPYVGFIPLKNIRKIEIIRGPGSALYGENAFLGVINIVTQKSVNTVEAHVEVSSFDTQKPYIAINNAIGEVEFSFNAQYHKTDGYKQTIESDFASITFPPGASAAPDETTMNSESHTWQAKVKYRDFEFTSFFMDLRRNYIVGLTNSLTNENKLDIKSTLGALTYTPDLGSYKSNLTLRAYWNDYNFNNELEIFSEETTAFFNVINAGFENNIPYPEDEGFHGFPKVDYRTYGLEANYDYDLGYNSNFLIGASYGYSKIFDPEHFANANVNDTVLVVEGQSFAPLQYFGGLRDLTNIENGNWLQEASRQNTALFVQSTIDLNERFSWNLSNFILTLGLRYDDYDDIGSTTNPRAGLVFAPSSKLHFKLLYGEAFRAPTFDELYQINNPASRGNPDLNAEEIKTSEFQIGYNFREGLFATISFFHLELFNSIQLVALEYTNIGSIESEGVEFELKNVWAPNKYAYLNATYAEAKNTTPRVLTTTSSSGEVTQFIQHEYDTGTNPDWMVNLGVNYQFSDFINTNIQINHTSDRDRSEALVFADASDSAAPTLVLADSRPATAARTLLNCTLSFKLNQNFKLQFSGYNLLDDDWHDPDHTNSLRFDLPREGANYRGSLSFAF